MYRNFAVKTFDIKGNIIFKNKGAATYVLYQYGQNYKPNKKYSVPQRAIIGKVVSGKPKSMYPNERFEEFFPDSALPEELPEA